MMMQDLHDMSEVGWLMRQKIDSAKEQQYLADHHLVGVPSLSDMFSITSTKYQSSYSKEMIRNQRVSYWDKTLADGLESSQACESMFNALFVDPHPLEGTFDLVLNPNDGPPPKDYESSASNVDCVIGLIAGLSVHPSVAGVEANLPTYYGWTAATLDAAA